MKKQAATYHKASKGTRGSFVDRMLKRKVTEEAKAQVALKFSHDSDPSAVEGDTIDLELEENRVYSYRDLIKRARHALVGEVVPNRMQMRHQGYNKTKRTGKNHARISGAKKTPASFFTLVAIHQRKADGTVRKLVVPRASFEGK